jgi:hypothetical protein
LLSRLFAEELNLQLDEALKGEGPWMEEAGKLNLEKAAQTSQQAEKFFSANKKQILVQQYVPYFKNGCLIFTNVTFLKQNQFYDIQKIQEIVVRNLKLKFDATSNMQAQALKLGKAHNLIQLIDGSSNYSAYRQALK